jgi:GMP synthase (glutamine-hydrolysing)
MLLPVWEAWDEINNMIVFIQNDPDVPAGAYADWLRENGIPFHIVRSFLAEEIPPITEITATIVLGGVMGVYEIEKHPYLLKVKKFIRDIVIAEQPYLGICLGGQLLADVLGAQVSSGMHGERGTHVVNLNTKGINDPLFHSLPEEFISFQWHNDSFDIPERGVQLAFSSACPNQAFRYGKNAYGLQFHPEVDEQIVTAWCCDDASGSTSHECVLPAFRKNEKSYRKFSLLMLSNYLRIAGLF